MKNDQMEEDGDEEVEDEEYMQELLKAKLGQQKSQQQGGLGNSIPDQEQELRDAANAYTASGDKQAFWMKLKEILHQQARGTLDEEKKKSEKRALIQELLRQQTVQSYAKVIEIILQSAPVRQFPSISFFLSFFTLSFFFFIHLIFFYLYFFIHSYLSCYK